MPIYIKDRKDNELIAKIGNDDWTLKKQVQLLEDWLIQNKCNIPSSDYVADIGFSVREDACGGGTVLSVTAMSIMAELGITLFLSEYAD